ncbi:MAG: DNA polymerase IV [Candidatus Peribacteraceae bacterium]|nr:DNA polymerase IV [Candidatus Peribacteraceae bacterium]
MFAHVDADAFFASVLVRKHPHLQGKPVLALGMGGGCVIAASYEAKAKGVKTGMRVIEARKLAPGAIEMPSDFRETGLASKQIEAALEEVCPAIEQMSIDEWFLDLRTMMNGIPEHLDAWAQEIRRTILQRTAISVSVGIGPTKTLAKMASEYRKPGGITVVSISDSDQTAHSTLYIVHSTFLHDRPAAAIPGIGPRRQIETEAHGWKTAWDYANADPAMIRKLFGKPGRELQQELLGESIYPIAIIRPPKSVSRCRSFHSTMNRDLVKAHLLKHLEYCTEKMRRSGLATTEIAIWVRGKEYRHDGRNMRVSKAAETVDDLLMPTLACLKPLLESCGPWNQVGLALNGLIPSGSLQQSLFENPKDAADKEELQKAVDQLHKRFGRDAVTRASALQVPSGTKKEMDLPIIG